ncbi:MAG: hypothetical protein WCP96_02785 [Methylococcaceae bacterium]
MTLNARFLPVTQHYLLSIQRLLLEEYYILDTLVDANDEIVCAM